MSNPCQQLMDYYQEKNDYQSSHSWQTTGKLGGKKVYISRYEGELTCKNNLFTFYYTSLNISNGGHSYKLNFGRNFKLDQEKGVISIKPLLGGKEEKIKLFDR